MERSRTKIDFANHAKWSEQGHGRRPLQEGSRQRSLVGTVRRRVRVLHKAGLPTQLPRPEQVIPFMRQYSNGVDARATYPHANTIKSSDGKEGSQRITKAGRKLEYDEQEQVGHHDVFATIASTICQSALISLSQGFTHRSLRQPEIKAPTERSIKVTVIP